MARADIEQEDYREPPVAAWVGDIALVDAGTEDIGWTTGTPGVEAHRLESGWCHDRFVEWLAALTAVRDAVGNLPGIPMSLWVLGVVVVGLARSVSTLRFRRRLHSARTAPEPVRRMVQAVARKLGLRRVPDTSMVDAPISPMVRLGLRPHLLLPTTLWSQFDDASREAILCHELAHLRRRDHWVCLAAAMISCVYWWHPMVWWVRRRLQAEAESCCDAWVTWLLPHGRRAYAEALLTAKQYVGDEPGYPSTLGIKVTTGRARNFARRLTMVMTQTMKPRLSASGILLAVSIALAGWTAVPARSCPPEAEKSDALGVEAVYLPHERCKPTGLIKSDASGLLERRVAALTGVGLGPHYLLTGAHDTGAHHETGLEERLAQLEGKLEQLSVSLDRIADSLGERVRTASPHRQRAPRAPRASRVPRAQKPPRRSRGPQAYVIPQGSIGPHAALRLIAPGVVLLGADEVVWRSYQLSHGKLDALSDLMVRSDVPILVRLGKDKLEVQATANQHVVFQAFIDMIDPDGDLDDEVGAIGLERSLAREAARGAKRNVREARRRARGTARSSVAERASREAYERAVMTFEDHKVNAFQEGLSAFAHSKDLQELTEMVSARAVSAGLEQLGNQRETLEAQVRMLAEQARAFERQSQQLEKQAFRIEEQAEKVEHQADKVEEHAEALRDRAQTLEKQEKVAILAEAEALAGQLGQLRSQAETLERQAETLEGIAEWLDDGAGSLQDWADAFREVIEALKGSAASAEREAESL